MAAVLPPFATVNIHAALQPFLRKRDEASSEPDAYCSCASPPERIAATDTAHGGGMASTTFKEHTMVSQQNSHSPRPFSASVGLCLVTMTGALVSGCASTYGNLASTNGLGANEYRPAVLVAPERQAAYEQVLTACRQASFNRQVTAAQKGQEGTLTAAVTGAAGGASSGYEMSNIFKSAGLGGSNTKGFLGGAGIGAMSGLASAFSSGTKSTSNETRTVLLTCLRSEAHRVGYTVLE